MRPYNNLICKCELNLWDKIHDKMRNDINPLHEALKKDANKPCAKIIESFSVEEITRTKVKTVKQYIFDRAKITLCQLLNFNTTKKARKYPSSFDHSETKDTSVVMYI